MSAQESHATIVCPRDNHWVDEPKVEARFSAFDTLFSLLGGILGIGERVADLWSVLILQRDFFTGRPAVSRCAGDVTDKRHGSASERTVLDSKPPVA